MEPGDDTVLKQRPRPKTEPVVLPYMWLSQIMNGTALTIVIFAVYTISLHHYCDGAVLQEDIVGFDGVKKARTVAFISLVLSENIRAYCARSFDAPFWRNFLGNKYMQLAIVTAEVAMVLAVFLPGLNDVLELQGIDIGGWGWGVAFIGPVGCVILCETLKIVTFFPD